MVMGMAAVVPVAARVLAKAARWAAVLALIKIRPAAGRTRAAAVRGEAAFRQLIPEMRLTPQAHRRREPELARL
jgi:hypothetical protein